MADIELNHVNSSPHGAYDVARENKPGLDTQTDATATAASSLTKDGAKQYDFLTGFRMYNLVAAMMLSMLLLGLDINIVATVSACSCLTGPASADGNFRSGYPNHLQLFPQHRRHQLVWLGLPHGHVSSARAC